MNKYEVFWISVTMYIVLGLSFVWDLAKSSQLLIWQSFDMTLFGSKSILKVRGHRFQIYEYVSGKIPDVFSPIW